MLYEKNLFNLCLQLHHAAEGDGFSRRTAKADIDLFGVPGKREIIVHYDRKYRFKVGSDDWGYWMEDGFEGFETGNYALIIADDLRQMGYEIPDVAFEAFKFNPNLKPIRHERPQPLH